MVGWVSIVKLQAKQGYIMRAYPRENKVKTKSQNKKYSCKAWHGVAHAYDPSTLEVTGQPGLPVSERGVGSGEMGHIMQW